MSSLPSTAVEGVNNFPTNGQQNDFLPKQSRFASRTDSHVNRDNPHLIGRDDYHGPEGGEYADRTNRTFDPRRGRRSRSRSRSPGPYQREDTWGRLRGPGGYSPPRRNMSDGDTYRSRGSGAYGGSGQTTGYQDRGNRSGHGSSGSGRFHGRGRGGPPLQSRPIPTFESSPESASVPPTSSSSSSIPPHKTVPNSVPQLNPRLLNAPYLNDFDFTTCDFSTPSSWEALAASFEKTNGHIPSQEELMQVVMMVAMTSTPAVDPTFSGPFDMPDSENSHLHGSNGEVSQRRVSDIDGTGLEVAGTTQVTDRVMTGINLNPTSPAGQEGQPAETDESAKEDMADHADAASEGADSRSSSMQMSESPGDPNN